MREDGDHLYRDEEEREGPDWEGARAWTATAAVASLGVWPRDVVVLAETGESAVLRLMDHFAGRFRGKLPRGRLDGPLPALGATAGDVLHWDPLRRRLVLVRADAGIDADDLLGRPHAFRERADLERIEPAEPPSPRLPISPFRGNGGLRCWRAPDHVPQLGARPGDRVFITARSGDLFLVRAGEGGEDAVPVLLRPDPVQGTDPENGERVTAHWYGPLVDAGSVALLLPWLEEVQPTVERALAVALSGWLETAVPSGPRNRRSDLRPSV